MKRYVCHALHYKCPPIIGCRNNYELDRLKKIVSFELHAESTAAASLLASMEEPRAQVIICVEASSHG